MNKLSFYGDLDFSTTPAEILQSLFFLIVNGFILELDAGLKHMINVRDHGCIWIFLAAHQASKLGKNPFALIMHSSPFL